MGIHQFSCCILDCWTILGLSVLEQRSRRRQAYPRESLGTPMPYSGAHSTYTSCGSAGLSSSQRKQHAPNGVDKGTTGAVSGGGASASASTMASDNAPS
uniref:Uncharacterized protein n=1 Tax=Arundo donax TaxID=35708 RepID=A0A0A9D6M5_ARUDO